MKRFVWLATLLSLAFLARSAHAGTKGSSYVAIGPSWASGGLGDARSSADGVQYIACRVSTSSTTYLGIFCEARDASGRTAQCSSSSANLLSSLQGLNTASMIAFYWDATGACTNITVETSSMLPPMVP